MMTTIKHSKRWVIKAGSSLLTAKGQGLDFSFIESWVSQVIELRKQGIDAVLISSGAVAEGLARLGWTHRPNELHELQAVAAIGQMGLIQAYESLFQQNGIHTAQVLLTHDDLSNRKRYLNARNTITTLLSLKVVPIINENDTVATDEIKFGDNDTLAALVANLLEAEKLILLTDQPGMYSADPTKHPDAKFIAKASANDDALVAMAGTGEAGHLGRGGMVTKVSAARLAARSGATTIIAGGSSTDILQKILDEQAGAGTWLYPTQQPLAAKKQWLAGHLQVKGRLVLDEGAIKAIQKDGKSLLPIGVSAVHGDFQRGEAVECVSAQGVKIATGLVNYASNDAKKIIGHASKEITSILNFIEEEELVHRDNMVLL